jgi:riboflavin biosynthesis pyrimidine reductase
LRACADVVVIGAETFRSSPGSFWTPGYIFPDADAAFGELRRRLGRSPEPKLAIITASGEIDLTHPALRAGALVFTTEQTAAGLRNELAPPSQVVALDQTAPLDLTAVIDHLRGLGHDAILTEGGPTVIGRLLEAASLDELFLTVSPVLAGRSA